MSNRKAIFAIAFIVALLMKQWWIVMPMLGFVVGYVARVEVERQRKGKRV